ncbi:FAD-dependent oxidoreductase [Marinifilum sp. RC60d5]|uniref:FAD-dependent oxidoreductase n=1 Tax=Marinifilum sp. RC60d5 TaxID=3458414 RepID=UPI004035A4B2
MITTIVKRISTAITLIKIEMESSDTYTFKFSVPEKIKWEPGAYAHFLSSDLQNGEKVNKESLRELSIMSHPDEKLIGFTTRIRQNPSKFKQALLKLKIGDQIRMFKIGNHFKKQKFDKPIVLISMGVGIATFRPLILTIFKNSSQVFPITNINIDRSGNFVYKNELESFSAEKIKNVLVCNRDNLYESINQHINNCENVYYVVGSKEFNKSIGDYLLEKNIASKNIVFDKR